MLKSHIYTKFEIPMEDQVMGGGMWLLLWREEGDIACCTFYIVKYWDFRVVYHAA